MNFYIFLVAISRSQLIYSNFNGVFTSTSFDWAIYQRDSHSYSVTACGLINLVVINECTNYEYNSLITKTFELPLHKRINLSFKFWIINSSRNGYEFYLYVDNQIIHVVQTSLYSLTNSCSSIGLYQILEISENIFHQSNSIQITMVSKQGRWGFSEFYLSADLLNNYQQNFELIYQSLNNLKFTSVALEDGWMTNSIISLEVFQCTDFNYLKSTGNNLIKDFVLKNHFKISFNLKVLIFNQTPTTIEIKIDNQLVSTYHSNSFVTSSLILCNNFIVIKVQVEDFMHNHNNLRIEVITQVNGSSSWFGIRDFQLFTTKNDYFCQDLNNQPFDGCFSNYYDCNLGCSNCIKGTCIKCLDGLILDIQNTCIPICGDRKIILNEACDDGNQIPYDGCHLCQFSCPLNCILCNFGICQVCEQSYFLQGNKCINDQQICDTFIELLETGFFYQMINYNENGYQFQQYHILQNIQNCYNFKDYFGILGYQYYYCQIIENCKLSIYETSQECQVSYKLSLNNRQCIQICNCEDQINFQYNDCYKCRQNCQLECLMCIQYKCYQCLDGWQLIDHKCQQICGDKQVALFSPEQCDNGNDIIDDGCHECQLQCQAYCQICSQDSICIICQQNFELINNKCQPICGDKIVIYGFEECDDGNDIQYDGCFQCQFQCNYGCQVCESGKCLIQCKEEEEFKNGECVLIPQTENEENQSDLIQCQDNCLICQGDLCLQCNQDYIFENNMCLTCGNGIINNDEECDDGNRMNNDGCSNLCKIEQNWNCIESIQLQSHCFAITKMIIVLLNTTFNTQYVKLSYTNKVKLDQDDINFLDFNINSINIDPTYYNISVFSVIQIISNETRNINYELKIQILKQLIQNPILNVNVNLNLWDQNDLLVPPSSQQIQLKAPIVLSKVQLKVSESVKSFGYNLMIVLGCIAIFACLIGSPFQFLEILDLLQFHSYLKFINVEYPQNIYIYFQSSEFLSIEPILSFLGIKDNLENYLGNNLIQSFGKFQEYQINADLITNIQCQLIQSVSFFSLLMILHIYLMFCSKFCFSSSFIYFVSKYKSKLFEWFIIKLYEFNKYIKKYQNFDNVNMIINWFYANAWDLSFKVLLYLTFNNQQGIRNIISIIFCLGYIILGISIVLRHFKRQNYKIFIKEIRNDQHQLIILIKKFIFLLILIGMQDNSVAQSIALSFCNCIYIGFILSIRFTNTKLDQINILFVEFPVILFTLINLSFCKDFKHLFTQDQILTIGFLQVGCLMMGLLSPLINCAYQFYQKVQLFYLRIKPKRPPIKLDVKNILFEAKV